MHAAAALVDQLGQGVHISGFELLQLPVPQHRRYDGVGIGDFLQYFLAGGVLTGFGLFDFRLDFQRFEKNRTQLFRAVDVERLACVLVYALRQRLNQLTELGAVSIQFLGINPHPFQLHICQNFDQGHLNRLEQFDGGHLVQFGPEMLPQLVGDIGVFASVIRDGFYGHIRHGLLSFSGLADEIGDGNGGIAQFSFGQPIQLVGSFCLDQVMGDHGIKHVVFEFDSPDGEHLVVELEVVRDDFFGGVGEDGLQLSEQFFFGPRLAMRRHPVTSFCSCRKGNSNQFSCHHVQR